MRSSDLAQLLHIASRGIPFTSTDGQAFVRLDEPPSGGFFILPVRSPAFRHWFFYHFYAEFDSLPSSQAFHAVLDHLEAQAHYANENQSLSVWRRVGARGGHPIPREILLDLADPGRRFVTISPEGWHVAPGDNALFQTSRSTATLPAPVPSDDPGPALAALRSCLNLPDRAAWIRCLAWLVSALRPSGPFPFLILQGPPASGKTFAARVLRSLIDPNASALTPVPSTIRDLLAVARQNWVLAFDHVSGFAPQIPDALCRLSTGLGASLRESPSEAEPLLQSYRRPVIITATSRWSPPPELAERALTVSLPALPPANRRPETELLASLIQAFPAILGTLCSAVGIALRRLPAQPPVSGRLPDAFAWMLAACRAGDLVAGQPEPGEGAFTEDEIREAFAAPIPRTTEQAVRDLLHQQSHWSGTATRLFELLSPLISCASPKVLSEQLRDGAPSLAADGITVNCHRSNGVRLLELSVDPSAALPENLPPQSAALSQPAESQPLLAA